MSPAPVCIRVHGLVADEPWMVRTLPAVPVAVKSATRWVVVPKLMVVAPVAVLLMLAKVLLPLRLNCPAPPWLIVRPEKLDVLAPMLKVFVEAEVKLRVPVPVTVSPVMV